MKKFLFLLLGSHFYLCETAGSLTPEIPLGTHITYQGSGGRFGDSLVAFSHALWFADNHHLPLVYNHFDYAQGLVLYYHPDIIHIDSSAFSNTITLNSSAAHIDFYQQCMNRSIPENSLLVVSYFPESMYETRYYPIPYMRIDWEKPEFLAKLQELIQPVNEYSSLTLPSNRTTVALHIRTGIECDHVQGYFVDGVGGSKIFPMKIPPMKYYLNSLKLLVGIVDAPLYVRIFTDDPNPKQILRLFQETFAGSDVVFETRESHNNSRSNVLEDFFAMKQFDCLVRSDSNFSLMADRLFPFKIVIAPETCDQKGNILTITKIEIKIRLSESADKTILSHLTLFDYVGNR